MSDPQTGNIGFYQPTRGSDIDTWDLPVNSNSGATDSLFANIATISLTNANVTLTTPPNSGAAWSGPYQSQSGILKLTGTLTGNCIITVPRAGFFIVDNTCTVGAFYVALASSAPGNLICAPPGEVHQIYCDGTDMKYANFPHIGSELHLDTATIPAWITNCTVPPYLNCNGASFSAVTYPQLAAYLGGTTLPDARGRDRVTLNQGTGRTTAAIGGLDGNTLLAGGGSQGAPVAQANLVSSITFPNTLRFFVNKSVAGFSPVAGGAQYITDISLGFAADGVVTSGGSNEPFATVPPSYVGGLTLIRAG